MTAIYVQLCRAFLHPGVVVIYNAATHVRLGQTSYDKVAHLLGDLDDAIVPADAVNGTITLHTKEQKS